MALWAVPTAASPVTVTVPFSTETPVISVMVQVMADVVAEAVRASVLASAFPV